jgi:hypothetical protein
MKIRRALLLLVPALLMYSCAPVMSLHKWYADEDVVTEPGLVGNWYSVDDKGAVDTSGTLTFAQDIEHGYTLTTIDKTHPGVRENFAVYAFKLGEQLLLDDSYAGIYSNGDELATGTIPAHMVGRLSIEPNNIRIDFLDDDWVRDTLKANPSAIRNERVDENVYLTAPEAELRRFLLDALKSEKAFAVTIKLVRTSAVPAAPTPAAPAKQ